MARPIDLTHSPDSKLGKSSAMHATTAINDGRTRMPTKAAGPNPR